MDEQQKQAFEEAVERKKEASEERSRAQPRTGGRPPEAGVPEEIQSDLVEPGTSQDTFSIRDKNAGKGQKTADKWNQ